MHIDHILILLPGPLYGHHKGKKARRKLNYNAASNVTSQLCKDKEEAMRDRSIYKEEEEEEAYLIVDLGLIPFATSAIFYIYQASLQLFIKWKEWNGLLYYSEGKCCAVPLPMFATRCHFSCETPPCVY